MMRCHFSSTYSKGRVHSFMLLPCRGLWKGSNVLFHLIFLINQFIYLFFKYSQNFHCLVLHNYLATVRVNITSETT